MVPEANRDLAKEQCPVTCGLCPVTCEDVDGPLAPGSTFTCQSIQEGLIDNGYTCDMVPEANRDLAKEQCPVTCGLCPVTCEDVDGPLAEGSTFTCQSIQEGLIDNG